MKYTIEDFKNGKVVIENNSKEVAIEILKKSFPNVPQFNGVFKYYWIGLSSNVWEVTDFPHKLPNLPVQKATDFALGPERGDYVWVRDINDGAWVRRIYITTVEGASCPYFVVNKADEEEFKKGKSFFVTFWAQMKPIEEEQIIELTIQDISDGKGVGIPAHLIRIKK